MEEEVTSNGWFGLVVELDLDLNHFLVLVQGKWETTLQTKQANGCLGSTDAQFGSQPAWPTTLSWTLAAEDWDDTLCPTSWALEQIRNCPDTAALLEAEKRPGVVLLFVKWILPGGGVKGGGGWPRKDGERKGPKVGRGIASPFVCVSP